MGGPFRFHGSTAGKYRWRYPTTLAAMEPLRGGYFLDAARLFCSIQKMTGAKSPTWLTN